MSSTSSRQQYLEDACLGKKLQDYVSGCIPIDISKALNILQDLMGNDPSLLPAVRLISSQPIFLQFLNTQKGSFKPTQIDAILQEASLMLAPSIIERLKWFLEGFAGLTRTASVLPIRPNQRYESSVNEPITVIAESTLYSPAPANANRIANLHFYWQILVAVLGIILLLGLFRSPLMCKLLNICSTVEKTIDTKKSVDNDKNLRPKPSTVKHKTPEKPHSKPPKVQTPKAEPAIPYQSPKNSSPPIPEPYVQPSTPSAQPGPALRPEPLW